MAEIIQMPDREENVEALRAMVHAVRASMAINFDREKFVRSAGKVWDGVVASDLADEDH